MNQITLAVLSSSSALSSAFDGILALSRLKTVLGSPGGATHRLLPATTLLGKAVKSNTERLRSSCTGRF